MKDTKLISKRVFLSSTKGAITARRLRNDECTLKTDGGAIRIGSYVETGDLLLETRGGDVVISKRLGIGKRGLLSKAGSVSIGSVFSNMAALPEKQEPLNF